LSGINRSDFPILPPTTTVLQKFARFSSWQALRAEFSFDRGRPPGLPRP
jgi:hypothetical protein